MPADDLGIKERAALLTLIVEARELSNQELEEIAGFRLYGKELEKLTGLVDSQKDHSRRGMRVHTLTDKGREWCRAELTADRPLARGAGSSGTNAFYVLLRGLGRYLDRTDQTLADVFGPAAAPVPGAAVPDVAVPDDEVEDRIRAVYRRLATTPGSWVDLADLRPALGDAGRDAVDGALRRMTREQRANLAARADQRNLTADDHAAAVRIGGEDNHRISIEE